LGPLSSVTLLTRAFSEVLLIWNLPFPLGIHLYPGRFHPLPPVTSNSEGLACDLPPPNLLPRLPPKLQT
jgi:hypothetical protein